MALCGACLLHSVYIEFCVSCILRDAVKCLNIVQKFLARQPCWQYRDSQCLLFLNSLRKSANLNCVKNILSFVNKLLHFQVASTTQSKRNLVKTEESSVSL